MNLIAIQHALVLAVSNVDLVKAGGSVKYTVIFHTGTSPILSGTTLSLTTSSSLAPPTPDISNPLSATCIGHDAGNNAVTMTPDGITTIPTASLAANITWTCTFDIAVTNNHRDAGEVGVFDVVYKYNVPGVTTAFHIPAVQTEAVPVYTAGVLSDAGHVVNTDGADGTFIQSGGFRISCYHSVGLQDPTACCYTLSADKNVVCNCNTLAGLGIVHLLMVLSWALLIKSHAPELISNQPASLCCVTCVIASIQYHGCSC